MNSLKSFYNYLQENYSIDGEKNTIKAYLADVKQFINYFKEHFGEDIYDFSRADITEFKKHIKEEKEYAYTTINRKIASLSVFEDFLIDAGIRDSNKGKLIKKSDFYKITRPFITANQLPREEIKKIRLLAGRKNARDYLIMILLDEGGLRVSELVNIELKRIDFEMYYITILGKGNKVRNIFMSEIIKDAINDYLPERELLLNGRENKYLLVSNKTANTNKPMGRTTINNILASYCESAKVIKINPHKMRHNVATKMYEEGKSDIAIKKALGQTSNVTDIYVHTGGENRKNL